MGLLPNGNSTSSQRGITAVDCTLGFGGHSTAILKLIIRGQGELIAFDQDQIELKRTTARLEATVFGSQQCQQFMALKGLTMEQVFKPVNDNFRNIRVRLTDMGKIGAVDALLADLGCSSMQIDNPQRGFTYKADGPLDMRMDTSKGRTAAQVIEELDVDTLAQILETNSDEEHAGHIAASVYSDRSNLPQSTKALSELVRRGVLIAHKAKRLPYPTKSQMEKAITRTMQAIRIEVNQEFAALDELLAALPTVMRSGGRVAILTFHSGEDRRVKKAFKQGFETGVYQS